MDGTTDDFDVRIDSINRLSKQIDVQRNLLNQLRQRALRIIRFIGLFISIILTTASLIIQYTKLQSFDLILPGFLIFNLGILFLFTSLCYSIVVTMGVVIEYEPVSIYANQVVNGQLGEDEYKDEMVRGYIATINSNFDVIDSLNHKFRNTIVFLVSGLISVLVGGLLIVIPIAFMSRVVVVAVTTIILFIIFWYFMNDKYLVLEAGDNY